MKKTGKFLILVIVVVVVQVFLNWFFRSCYNPVSPYPKARICETLKPGITVSELDEALGIPLRKEVGESGEVWFHYASDRFASVPIKARVDREAGLV